MAFDYKKEYKEFYMPPKSPVIIEIPSMNYIAVRGQGNPNEENGAYQNAVGLLYGVAYTIKMSKKGSYKIPGFFDYVVPPLEGLWEQGGRKQIDLSKKEEFHWISMIRLPEFITKEHFEWAVEEAEKKKKMNFSNVEFFTYKEGLCMQCMHIGSYDEEATTLQRMEQYALARGYVQDISAYRMHHEIYLSDPRRTEPSQRKTVLRHPIKPKKGNNQPKG